MSCSSNIDWREGNVCLEKETSCKLLSGAGSLFLTMASYLAISDFYSIGEEQRYNSSADQKNDSASAERCTPCPMDQVVASDDDGHDDVGTTRTERSRFGGNPAEAHRDIASSEDTLSTKVAMAEPRKRKRGAASLDLDPDLISLASNTQKLNDTPSAKMTRGRGHEHAHRRSSHDNLNSASTPNIPLSQKDSNEARSLPERVSSPLHLSTLASITGTNATRNRQVNILAMIERVSTSTVKPTTAPLKRDVRIIDPSTDRKVTLSVFVDPVNFVPKEYDIMLFCELTTHDFSGGNLNAYPKKCKGKEWYILNPYDIAECDMKSMEIFREHYQEFKAQAPR